MPILNEDFWERQWQSAIDNAPTRRRAIPSDQRKIKRWDKMAADFAKHTSGPEQNSERLKRIQELVEMNAVGPGRKVLDIGAGPGSWALPLAETGALVTALEPASGMTQILKERAANQNVRTITIDQRTWQSVNLEEDNWHGAFDLVFASMTPGIDGPDNLRKMIAASRGFCYLSAFSGSGWRRQYAELWQTFFDEPLGEQPNDIIYPFNFVYAMGFRPRLYFTYWQREKNWSRDQAFERFSLFFETYMDLTDAVKKEIIAFIDRNCTDGRFIQSHRACRGVMIWHVAEKQPQSEMRIF